MQKTLIFETVVELLAKAQRDISLDALAKKLGIKKQSLYSYFSSKEELLKQSLEYVSSKIAIVQFDVDFSSNIDDILKKIMRHYVELFSDGIARDYFSCIFCLVEFQNSKILNLTDIKYSIESQIYFVLNELKERGCIKTTMDLESLSHILMLSIIDVIQSSRDEDEREFELNKLYNSMDSFLKNGGKF